MLGIALSLALIQPAAALTLEGKLTQGSLIEGRTQPEARVSLDGKPVEVAPDGSFLIAFSHDAAPTSLLDLAYADGGSEQRRLAIERRRWQIQRIQGLPEAQVTPKPEDLQRIRDDNRQIAQVRTLDTPQPWWQSGFAWPVTGRIASVFGSQRVLNGEPRAWHNGVDIAAPVGTPIRAPADGVVRLAHPDMFLTGITLMIDHGYGLTTVYAHLSKAEVKPGDTVRQGQEIGRVGQSGRATGPHLHWGMSLYATLVDPALLLPPMPAAAPN
jgi:murein DD-endopeptidase MepM/ murein hydrolase activator NlpD